MSPLRTGCKTVTDDNCFKYDRPSPTADKNSPKRFSQIFLISPSVCMITSLEGISLPARGKGRRLPAGMTLEAAFLMPLLLFFFLHLFSVVEMLRLHGKLELALWNTGRQLALYGPAAEALRLSLPDIGVSYLYVDGQVRDLLGEEYLEDSPLAKGAKGLNYLSSSYLEEDQCVDIAVTYQVRPSPTLFPVPYLRLANRCFVRAWTGYDVSPESPFSFVYVTDYGEVWHRTCGCVYLDIQVKSLSLREALAARNAEGKKYKPCERCYEGEGECVYLTGGGERYHSREDCPSLKRTVRAIPWGEAAEYRPCGKCANQEGEKR